MAYMLNDVEYNQHDIEFFQQLNAADPVSPPPRLISEFIESVRVMPPDSPFPGPWKNDRTPYIVEIIDSLAPHSGINYVDIMSAAQVVKTASAEAVVAYYMAAEPCAMLYINGTDDLLRKWWTKRLEPLIDSIGMRDEMRAVGENKSSRQSGDTQKQKLFPGGFLEKASAQSPSSLRADSVRVLILDEIDSAPRELTTGEGNWIKAAEARTKYFGWRRKILAISTPTIKGESLIEERYLRGDRRQYYVPCPFCDEMQILRRGSEKKKYGLRPVYNAEKMLVEVWYQCGFCGKRIDEYQKPGMMTRGEWRPTAVPTDPRRRSGQIGSLYSPIGAYSWLDYYKDWLEALETPDGMRSFINLQDGLPYAITGARSTKSVKELVGGYKTGEVPDGVLFLTMFVDVQKGGETEMKRKTNPPRLELEVCGHGSRFRTWSIVYKKIEGAIDDPYAGAWAEMEAWAKNGGLRYIRRRDGREFHVSVIFIDSGGTAVGDTTMTSVVYDFCPRWRNTYPTKGINALKKRLKNAGDTAGPQDFQRYKISKVARSTRELVSISTNYYKQHIYRNLQVKRKDNSDNDPEVEQASGFCDFPKDYSSEYFDGLQSEEMRSDGSFHKIHSERRNEPLDLRVGNCCAADFYLDGLVRNQQAVFKTQGRPDSEVASINHIWVLKYLERLTAFKTRD